MDLLYKNISLTSALDGVGSSTSTSGRFNPRKEIRYYLYRRVGRSHGRHEQVQNISPIPGFHHRTGNGKLKYKIISKHLKYLETFRKVSQMKVINSKQKERHAHIRTLNYPATCRTLDSDLPASRRANQRSQLLQFTFSRCLVYCIYCKFLLTVFKKGVFIWLSHITFKRDVNCMLQFCKLASHGGCDKNRCWIREHINIKGITGVFVIISHMHVSVQHNGKNTDSPSTRNQNLH